MMKKVKDVTNIILLTFLPMVPNKQENQRMLVGSSNKNMHIVEVGKFCNDIFKLLKKV